MSGKESDLIEVVRKTGKAKGEKTKKERKGLCSLMLGAAALQAEVHRFGDLELLLITVRLRRLLLSQVPLRPKTDVWTRFGFRLRLLRRLLNHIPPSLL